MNALGVLVTDPSLLCVCTFEYDTAVCVHMSKFTFYVRQRADVEGRPVYYILGQIIYKEYFWKTPHRKNVIERNSALGKIR